MAIAPNNTHSQWRDEKPPACELIPVDWPVLVPKLVHPTKVFILEAMHWIGRPMSATEFEEVASEDTILKSFSYHLKHLAEAGVLEVVDRLKTRKSQSANKETFFFFVGQHQWASLMVVLNDAEDPLMAAALGCAARHRLHSAS